MGLFRRAAKGRHALGAAVTSIPSGPLKAAPLPAAAALPPTAVAAPAAPSVGEPSVLASIAELIATGEAWADQVPAPFVATAVAPAPARATVDAPTPPPTVAPAQPLAPAAPRQAEPAPSVRTALEAALVQLLPLQAAEPPAAPPVQPGPSRRVQLGFRDGTSANLDPSSSQFQALEELAESLTRRD